MSIRSLQTQWDGQPPLEFRYETTSAPTEEMWDAMKGASKNLGMASGGEDPVVNELEMQMAEATGKEKAMFLPTTTIASMLAMQSLDLHGKQVILEARSHLYWVEQLHISEYAGAAPVLLQGDKFGAIPLHEIETIIKRSYYSYQLNTGLICLENTHNICGGTCLSPDYTGEIAELGRQYAIPLFLDGARVFNAAVAQGIPVKALTKQADVVVLSLNKGLLAPVGGMLCGTEELLERARLIAKRTGTISMHKAGILAAAALVGLKSVFPLLAKDHELARQLALELSKFERLEIDLETVQTNFVRVDTSPAGLTAYELSEKLAEHGLAVHVIEPYVFKMVTRHGMLEEDVDQAVDIFSRVLN